MGAEGFKEALWGAGERQLGREGKSLEWAGGSGAEVGELWVGWETEGPGAGAWGAGGPAGGANVPTKRADQGQALKHLWEVQAAGPGRGGSSPGSSQVPQKRGLLRAPEGGTVCRPAELSREGCCLGPREAVRPAGPGGGGAVPQSPATKALRLPRQGQSER